MRFILAFLVGSLLILFTTISTQTYASSIILINEFASVTDGSSTNPDWVEIYNNSTSLVSLDGWTLKDSTNSNKVTLSGCISAKNYRKFNFSNKLNNSGDEIRLFDKNSNLVDAISYFSAEIPPHQKGGSTGRSTENNSTWQAFTTPTPIDYSCKTQTIYLKLTLSEIYPNPQKDGREWVEIYNPNTTKVDLAKWVFLDSANHKKELAGSITAKSYKTFYFSSGWLNNGGDSVKLVDPSGKNLEGHKFDEMDKEFSIAKNSSGSWKVTMTPTPGAKNIITISPATILTSDTGTENESDILESTGLEPSLDFITDSFQSDFPVSTTEGKVAGVNQGKTNSNAFSTLLISAGISFLGTSLVWPILEKKKWV